MSGMLPVAVYGLKVPAGDVMIPAIADFPATVGISGIPKNLVRAGDFVANMIR